MLRGGAGLQMTEEGRLGKWDQLNKCPECGRQMERVALVGEQVGLYYRCPTHGRYRYSWDSDILEPAPEG
jgi:hypothetical protein